MARFPMVALPGDTEGTRAMTPSHCTDSTTSHTDPCHWEQIVAAAAVDPFHDPDHAASQRQYARQHGSPRSTLGHWLRQPDPEGVDPDTAAFFRSSSGVAWLRRLVLALFAVFLFRGACGVRLFSLFLRRTQLDRRNETDRRQRVRLPGTAAGPSARPHPAHHREQHVRDP